MTLPPSLALLGHPEAYLAQIERLRAKYGRMRRLDTLQHRGLSLGDLGVSGPALARLLAREVSSGAYELGPVVPRPALIGGKRRVLCRSNLVDTIVLGVLASALAAASERVLSKRVYSYRLGRSSWETLAHLREYFAAHRRERPDVRRRGLYVLHRDVRSYGESIPTADDSVLWIELGRMLGASGVPDDHFVWKLVRGAMRPDVKVAPGEPVPRVGVPTGSPVQTIACNLYLGSVDRSLESMEGAFYARFGDDMLFCHPDAAVARRVATEMDEIIRGLGLEVKAEKRRDYYLTGPGRASAEWPESRPTSKLDYLGFRLDLAGTVGLKAAKGRRLIRELRLRARSAAREAVDGVRTAPPLDEARARAVCGALASALDPMSPLSDPAAAVLRYVITDRALLGSLDHALALTVAELLSGVRGPRAFRVVPYRFLRARAGLPSLVVARNRGKRAGGEQA